MAKQKKNSNYVTEKTLAAKAEQEEARLKEEKTKKITTISIWSGAIVLAIGLIVLFLVSVGAFKYQPEVTDHASVTLSDGSTLHIELYGKDAPKTVEHFKKIAKEGYFTGRSLHTLLDGKLYVGNTLADSTAGVKGEFKSNGYDNKIPADKYTVYLSRGEGKDSGYGQFFILTEKDKSVKNDYAAFGKLSDSTTIKNILDKATVGADGKIESPLTIVSIDFHSSDSH